jgi:predicted nucleic acid-binding protein
MVVVDSSVWIDFFNGQPTSETDLLVEVLGCREVVVGDLVLGEVLQGFRSERDFKFAHQALTACSLVSMLDIDLAVVGAQNFRRLRRRGVTVRKSIDVMIATWCIANRQELLYSDRDFDPFVEHLGLRRAA